MSGGERRTGWIKKRKTKGDTESNERNTEELEKSRNEARTCKQMLWSVHSFQTWFVEKDLAIHFKSISKIELNQSLRQFYAAVKHGRGELSGLSSYVSLHAGLNPYINNPPTSRSWCLMEDPAFTTRNNNFVGELKKLHQEGRDKTIAQLMAISM